MSRSLGEAHLVITEEQYEALQKNLLFIVENGTDLSLVDFEEYYTERAAYFFEHIASCVKQDSSYLKELQSQLYEGIDLFDFFNLKLMEDKRRKVPVPLEEWLEFDDGDIDYYIERYVTEEQIGDTKFYLLILVYFC